MVPPPLFEYISSPGEWRTFINNIPQSSDRRVASHSGSARLGVNQSKKAATAMGADKSGERVPVVTVAVTGGCEAPEAAAATPKKKQNAGN